MRLDDQALIPAELWDEDEDRYQEWYYTRYPQMREIIQQKKYIQPSWLGSLDIMVPWDKEFHQNHCVRICLPLAPPIAQFSESPGPANDR